jgi:hypothetical protein
MRGTCGGAPVTLVAQRSFSSFGYALAKVNLAVDSYNRSVWGRTRFWIDPAETLICRPICGMPVDQTLNQVRANWEDAARSKRARAMGSLTSPLSARWSAEPTTTVTVLDRGHWKQTGMN